MAEGTSFLGWCYYERGRRLGPFTTDQMIALAAADRVKPTDRVALAWRIGQEVRYFDCTAGFAMGAAAGRRPPPALPN